MKSHRRQVTVTTSNQVLDYLETRGFDGADVARMIGLREGFVQLIRNRERGLTVDHLAIIADRLAMPFAAFLDAAVPVQPKSSAHADAAAAVRDIGKMVDESIELIRHSSSRKQAS